MAKQIEDERRTLQKHVAGLVITILDPKANVKALEKGAKDNKNDNLETPMENQNSDRQDILDLKRCAK